MMEMVQYLEHVVLTDDRRMAGHCELGIWGYILRVGRYGGILLVEMDTLLLAPGKPSVKVSKNFLRNIPCLMMTSIANLISYFLIKYYNYSLINTIS